MDNLFKNLKERIAQNLNAKSLLNLRLIKKRMIRKPSQKRVAGLMVRNKLIQKNRTPTALQVRRRGYPMNKIPAHNLSGRFTEGNNAALTNAIIRRLSNKGYNKINLFKKNYKNLLKMESNITGQSVHNINKNLRRTAPRGIKYALLAGGNAPSNVLGNTHKSAYKNIINRMRRYQVSVPGKAQKALNKIAYL